MRRRKKKHQRDTSDKTYKFKNNIKAKRLFNGLICDFIRLYPKISSS